MKTTLSTQQAADLLHEDQNGGWSRAGAYAMAEHLEELEDDTGEELEFDACAIRCEYSEYESAVEGAEAIGWEDEDFSDLDEPEEPESLTEEERAELDEEEREEYDAAWEEHNADLDAYAGALGQWEGEKEERALEWLRDHEAFCCETGEGGVILRDM
jgi:hypothetical protein